MLRWLVGATLALTLFVVSLGAYVRVHDAGLGCPDWPGCYGQTWVPETAEQIAVAHADFPQQKVEKPKAWKEMVHRAFAGSVVLLILVLTVRAWQLRQQQPGLWRLPLLLFAVVLFQAALGMWTVTLLLMPVVVTGHLLGGMTTLALLAWLWASLASPTGGKPHPQARLLRNLAWLTLLAVGLQIALGGWVSTNYAGLACVDFPSCQQSYWPEMRWSEAFVLQRQLGHTAAGAMLTLPDLVAIHWLHRLGALLVSCMVLIWATCLFRAGDKKMAGLLLLLLSVQVTLGVANVLLRLPTGLAVAHNAVAALLLVLTVTQTQFWQRQARGQRHLRLVSA